MKIIALIIGFSFIAMASDLKVGDNAPTFNAKTDSGQEFNLQNRKKTWTILYFYPKAETPGCTKQACAFSDNVEKIKGQGAEVFGISADPVADLKKFKDNHKLKFTLLADPEMKAIDAYGAKMMGVNMSKRWTFIIGPDLKIAAIDRDVDPIKDWELRNFKNSKRKSERRRRHYPGSRCSGALGCL